MPIYEYQCASCGHQMEAIQKVSDEPLSFCPACAESKLKKMVTAPSFRLSGTGWYETDFKPNNKKNLASKDDANDKPATSASGDSNAA